MSKDNIILKAEGVSKQYRLGLVGTGTLSDDLKRWWYLIRGKEDPFLKIGESNDRSKKGGSNYVWALQDINFEVQRGEVLGIIGKNGAGKSTLLKILSKVTLPTIGEIKTKGRIASLLEVGTGFHPEMTGRENIYLNGAILGMTKAEIKSKEAEIIDFSGCAGYIDTPVKRYSSGMRVRLAFAVAAHLEPDILVIDEVLAVGDAEFQKKAIGKMQDISQGDGRTVLFVSHNMAAVKNLCTRVMVLKNGQVAFNGQPLVALEFYLKTSEDETKQPLASRLENKSEFDFCFLGLDIINENNTKVNKILSGEQYTFRISYYSKKVNKKVGFRIMFIDNNNQVRFLCNNYFSNSAITIQPTDKSDVDFIIPNFPLPKGDFYIRLTCFSENGILDDIEKAFSFDVLGGDFYNTGKEQLAKLGVLVNYQFKF